MTLFLTILTFSSMGQKLLVENQKGKKKIIKLGSIMTVTTFSDSTNSDPFHYKDPIDTSTSYGCLTGCYKLISVDTVSNMIQIQRSDSLVLNYKISEVKSINFVKAKHPYRVRRWRISLAGLGSLVLIIHTITIGGAESTDQKIGPYIVATAMIGYGIIDSRNDSKPYKLLGTTK